MSISAVFDKKTWLHQMLRLQVLVATSKYEIFGTHLSFVVGSQAYLVHNQGSPFSSAAAFGTTVTLAATAIILSKFDYLSLKLYQRTFANRRTGLRAIRIAHTALLTMVGKDPVGLIESTLHRLNETIKPVLMWPSNEVDDSRIAATGVELRKPLAGTAQEMADQIIREALYQHFNAVWVAGEKLSPQAQRYIAAKDPDWVQKRPALFDAPRSRSLTSRPFQYCHSAPDDGPKRYRAARRATTVVR